MFRIVRRATRKTVRKATRATVKVTASAARGTGRGYIKASDAAHNRQPGTFTRPKWASHPVSF
jgi:hypothetical protein